MRTAIVTDAERPSALAMIRSLARDGWRVLAATPARLAMGAASRHSAGTIRYPDPLADPGAAVGELRAAAAAHGADVLFPVTDYVAVPLRAARHDFDGVCRLALPSDDAFDAVTDKRRTIAVAERAGVPVPATRCVTAAEQLRDAGAELGWPLVLKPARSLVRRPDGGAARLSVAYASNVDDAIARWQALSVHGPVLVQRRCRGAGVAVNVLARDGEVVAALQQRRLHEVPLTGGPSSRRVTEPLDHRLLAHAEAIMGATGWTGIAMVELKVGPDGPALMEVNGRPWGSLALSVLAGVDFPALWAALVVDGSVPAARPGYAPGVTAVDLGLEVRWAWRVLRGEADAEGRRVPRRAALAALAGLLSPRQPQDARSWRDPLPGLAEVAALLGTPLRRRRG